MSSPVELCVVLFIMAKRDLRMHGPLVFDTHVPENWRKFEICLVTKGKDDKADKLKVNMLLHCAGQEAIQEYGNFVC